MSGSEDFYRIQKLPPYVFAVINEMKAKARAAQMDVVDLGMGNPDGATPEVVVDKLVEAARNPRNHRYSLSRGIPHLREEICKRYKRVHNVDLNAESRISDSPVRRDHVGRLLAHAADAECRDIPGAAQGTVRTVDQATENAVAFFSA
jgi:alanine-synthesizing transaminase